jgi:hypothetical protein
MQGLIYKVGEEGFDLYKGRFTGKGKCRRIHTGLIYGGIGGRV